MIQKLKDYISDQGLFSSEDKILLAVSGGKDSVCMSHLFAQADLPFGIAHCNFKLRADASDEDATFVKDLAQQLGVKCFTKSFETAQYAKTKKVSIQMAARDLRYLWLEKIRSENDYAFIATAHHLNDSTETVLYNFAKGCGIRGLHGILPKSNYIIRPLLFAEGSEIEDYVKVNQLAYREDLSNASDKYSRNFIRHQIIPKFKKLNPAFEKSADETIQRLRDVEFLFEQSIQNYKTLILTEKGQEIYIDYHQLPSAAASTVLYEILKPMGFHGDQVKMILNQKHQSGIYFYSNSHTLLIDRDQYIVRKKEVLKLDQIDVLVDDKTILFNGQTLSCTILDTIPNPISKDSSTAVLDFDKLSFPLRLRPWKPGDIFQPFGMKGKHQKIQDFLTHKKLSRFEKEAVYVLESAGEICWVVGMRIDERFRVWEGTAVCYLVEGGV